MRTPKTATSFAYNILGVVLPLFLTIFTTPIYLRHIGAARFGVLALIWVTVGYFGLLDLGLSRATANRIARTKTADDTLNTFWSATWTSVAFGLFGALLLYASMKLFGHHFFQASPILEAELQSALPFLCLFIPLATTSGVFIGAMEAKQRFLQVNSIAIGGSAMFALLPLIAALTISPSLAVLIPAATISRLVTVVLLFWQATRGLELRRVVGPARAHVRDLLGYGGWAAISTFVGTIMNNIDQLAIGAMLGAAAVAHYAVPYNVVSRLTVVPSALLRALFPRLSNADPETSREIEYAALSIVCVALTTLCVFMVLILPLFLRWWLRAQLDPISITVAIVLTVGVWFNGVATVPFWTLQAQGRPHVPARLHLLEILPYLAILFMATHYFGLIGAACAWALRTAADAALLMTSSKYRGASFRTLGTGLLLVLAAAALALTVEPAIWLLVALALAIPVLYRWIRFVDGKLLDRVWETVQGVVFKRRRLSVDAGKE